MDDKTVEQIAELTKKILIKAGKPVYGDSVLDMYLKGLSEGRRAKLSSDHWIEHRVVKLNEIILYAVSTIEQMAALAQIELPIDCDKMKSERYFSLQQEGTPMSDLIRQEVNGNLSLRLSSLINVFPDNDYHYEELQRAIGRTILQHDTTEMSRRESVKLVVLAPVSFCSLDGIVTLSHVQTDNATLLKHIAAAIAGCWYIKHHRGKEHAFINGLVGEYIKILQGVACSKLETHRKAAFSLLAQSLLLRAGIVHLWNNNAYALQLAEQACSYSVQAHDMGLEAYANRLMAQFFWHEGKYEKALEHANRAKALIGYGNLDELTQSWVYSGASYCQAFAGKKNDSVTSIKLARDLFDDRLQTPTAMQFSTTILYDCAGITALRNGNYKEAADLFEEEVKVAQTPLGEVQAWLGRAKVEATRDDTTRNGGMVLHLIGKSADKAREMGSQLFVNRAREIFEIETKGTTDAYWKKYYKQFEQEHFLAS
jgi:tetratricopeptide (TPR) repeat protein